MNNVDVNYSPSVTAPDFVVTTKLVLLPNGVNTKVGLASPNRVTIKFWGSLVNTLQVGPQAVIVAGLGDVINPLEQGPIYKFSDFGAMVAGEWWAVQNSGGPAQVAVTDVAYQPRG